MIYIIIALALVFIAGFLVGKSGKFYSYVDNKLYNTTGMDKYNLWMKGTGAIGVELFGIDYTQGVLTPVYRPAVRFVLNNGIVSGGFRIGDFGELNILVSYRFPFIKWIYVKDIGEARSFDE